MKLRTMALILALPFIYSLQSCIPQAEAEASGTTFEEMSQSPWKSIEEAVSLSAKNDKKILVDIYTDWCKWCQVMDEKTFSDPKVQSYLEENFNLAKLNAEQQEPIRLHGKEYSYVNTGRRGVNLLANEMLDGRMSYPSVVVYDKDFKRLEVIRGFKTPDDLLAILKREI